MSEDELTRSPTSLLDVLRAPILDITWHKHRVTSVLNYWSRQMLWLNYRSPAYRKDLERLDLAY